MRLTKIIIYPIKSLGSVELDFALIDDFGLQYDRRWMLINREGKALTQRELPELSLLNVVLDDDQIIVTHKVDETLQINVPLTISDGEKMNVKIWEDECIALKAESSINEQFTKKLGMNVSLVYLPDANGRIVNTQYANKQEITSFTDGFPVLIIGEESLNLLNSKLEEKVTMNRFRPNLVFSGEVAHCEDEFKIFRIGNAYFKAVKPCSRCVVTNINPSTSSKGVEPLKTLNTYRNFNNKVMFGMNILVQSGKVVRVGDKLELVG